MTRMAEQSWRRAAVLGFGASGEAAARLLQSRGVAAGVFDSADGDAVAERAAALRQEGIRVFTGVQRLPPDSFDAAVVSPGISAEHPWLADLSAWGIPVISELELGWRYCSSRILAVTGSNGKSTLVKLCREAMEAAGLRAEAGANYGTPLSAIALRSPAPDWIVAEVSSFQLERVDRFRPDVGVLLNLNPNHLDRHGTLDAYAAAKSRLFENMGEGSHAIVPAGAPDRIRNAIPRLTRVSTFGVAPDANYRYRDGIVSCAESSSGISVKGTAFDNDILGLTAAAGVAAMSACKIPPSFIASAAAAFQKLPHRMETVATIRGVLFVDDSKATNLAAMAAGLQMATGPVCLIAGGLLKESDLDWVKKVLVKKARGVYIIGKYSQVMATAWRDACPCHVCGSLKEAVYRAWKEARAGDVVLLSPGCASFDQFSSFEDRGNQFKHFVGNLIKGDVS